MNDELTKGKVTLIDNSEAEELIQNGKIAAAVNAPRGMAECCAHGWQDEGLERSWFPRHLIV